MTRLEKAAEHLEARKAAAFGVQVEELDGEPRFGGNDLLALCLSGEDVDVAELQDMGRIGVANMWNARPAESLEELARLLLSAWIEGVLFGVSLASTPDE